VVTKQQRQRQLAREKWRRQQERKSRIQRRNRVLGVVFAVLAAAALVALAVWFFALRGDDEPETPPATTLPTGTAPTTTAPTDTAPTTPAPTATTGPTTTQGTP
jgi:peptidyl-prolyl cis-trans isomerase B (cyclophilin B)